MTPSDELIKIANTLILVDPDAFERLHRIARDVRKLERFADEIVANARQDEILASGLRPIVEFTDPLLERAIRLSSQEKL